MNKIISLFLALFIFTSVPVFAETEANPSAERGFFVSVIENPPVLTSRDAITSLVAFAKEARAKKLFVQVYREGKAWFKTSEAVVDPEPYQAALQAVGEDPLALLIKEAQAAGLEVHAWVNMLSLGQNEKAPLLEKYGLEILTRNKDEKKTVADYRIDNQFWLEPGDLRVRSELSKLIAELAAAYPELNGIQLDYIRYPDTKPAYGHNFMNLRRYQQATGMNQLSEKTPEWRKWKRDQVTQVVQLLRARALNINPKLQFSTTGCSSYTRAREEAFQDWGEWLNKGYADFVTMMNYPEHLADFKKNVEGAKLKTDDFRRVYLGVGAYKLINDVNTFNEIWKACENDFSRGCVVFYYGNLVESENLRKVILGTYTPTVPEPKRAAEPEPDPAPLSQPAVETIPDNMKVEGTALSEDSPIEANAAGAADQVETIPASAPVVEEKKADEEERPAAEVLADQMSPFPENQDNAYTDDPQLEL